MKLLTARIQSSGILLKLVVLVFMLLFGFAVFAAFERVNSDAGYYLFKSINLQFFYMEHGRMVLWVAEVLPLIGTWLGLPLFWVILLYSINHVLVFAASAYFSYRISGKWNYPVTIALTVFMGLRESVFTPQFELYYGLVFLVLFMTISEQYFLLNNKKKWMLPAMFLCAVFTVTSHPMALLLLIFALLVFSLVNHRLFGQLWLGMLVFVVIYAVWKKFTISDYEGGKFGWYYQSFRNGEIWTVFSNGHIAAGLKLLWKYYLDVCAFFTGMLIYWFREKRPLYLGLYVLGVFIFVFSAWAMYLPGPYLDRYLEQIWYPIVFAVFLPVMFIKRLPNWFIPVLIFSMIYRIFWINDAYRHYHSRTMVMDNLITKAEKQEGNRFVASETDMGKEAYDFANWSLAFETMLRSVSSGKRVLTIIKDEDYRFNGNDSLLTGDQYLFRMWEREPVSSLNTRYFKLGNGIYRPLKP